MDSKKNENVNNVANQPNKPKTKVIKWKSAKKKKVKPAAKTNPSKETQLNNDINSSNIPIVNAMEPKVLEPIYPDQSQYQNQLPVQNTEQVNKQYQLEDIVRKAQTTINFIKALNTTVVKPVIVQEVTTRKPIIAPVNIKTPVNFFEGQPLSEADLMIQNFFKNTTPVAENSEQYYQNYYSYTKQFPMNQTNNENVMIHSSQIPGQQQQQIQTKKVTITKSVQYPSQQQQSKKVTTITQSVQYPSQQQQQQQTKKVTITKSVQHPSQQQQQQQQQLRQQPQPQITKNNIPTQAVQYPPQQQVNNVNANANVNVPPQSVQYQKEQQPAQVKNLNIPIQSIQYSQKQQTNNVFAQPPQSARLPNTAATNQVLIQKQNFIQNSPDGTTKVKKMIKKVVNNPQVNMQSKQINIVQSQNQNVVMRNSPKKNNELTKSLKHVEKVKNITINNTLKETYPGINQQKQVMYKGQNNDDDDDEDDDDKMPRDSIRK